MLNGNSDSTILRRDYGDDDELYMMAGDDPSAYFLPAPLVGKQSSSFVDDDSMEDDDDEDYQHPSSTAVHHQDVIVLTNSTNQMLDVVNNKRQQRKGNRNRHQQSNRNRYRQNQNDGALFDENNPVNVISAFNRTGKIYNKLRKNDAVKVVDTPSGRAGFVYQSSSSSSNSGSFSVSSSSNIYNNKNHHHHDHESSASSSIRENWNDSYPQSQFVNRNANDVKLIPSTSVADDTNNKKILPVLTKDGKIALVVRGDTTRYFDENQNNGSGNIINTKKYEPITNLTSIITALNSNNDNNNNLNVKQNDSISRDLTSPDLKSIQEQNRLINRLDDFFASVTNKVKHIEEEIEQKLGIDLDEMDSNEGQEDEDSFHVAAPSHFNVPTTSKPTTKTAQGDLFGDEDRRESLLINRPLSEVLGLPKKTHYLHPHESMPIESTSEVPKLSNNNENRKIDRFEHPASTIPTIDSSQAEEFDLESPEKINIAVIPRFDSELEERLFGKNRDNTNQNLNDVSQTSGSASTSSIHNAIQVMISIGCACVIIGVLGTFYRIELINHIRIIYW